MEHFVHALFPDREAAAKTVNALVNSNFPPAAIGALLASDRMHVEELVVERRTIVKAAVVVGAIAGAAGGLLVLAAVGLVSLATPGEALAGAAAGGLFGIFAGGLSGLGYWRYVIDFPRGMINESALLVGVATNRERIEEARRVLHEAGAVRTHVSTKNQAAERALEWARSHPHFGPA